VIMRSRRVGACAVRTGVCASTSDREPVAPHGRRAGFTLIELLISMIISLVVLAAGADFAAGVLRSSRGSDLRDGLNRDARFVGMAISRDLGNAGVNFASTQDVGSVGMRGDTVLTLSVPFLPNAAESYPMQVPVSPIDPLPPGGTCGATCIDVVDPMVVPFQLSAGDLAVLSVMNERRLVVVTNVSSPGPPSLRRIDFSSADSLFTWGAGFSGGLRLRRNGVALQKLQVAGWFRDVPTGTLRRVDAIRADGTLNSVIAARGADTLTTRVLFTNGVEGAFANPADADTTNDYDRIVSVVVRARLRVAKLDRSVNGGAAMTRDYEWRVSPRNLVFERNRSR
jgi:prepilin-type N-terminal cleavage/methylation domain-containing protein